MSVENFLETVPAYAKDLKLNLSAVLRQTELTPQQLWGTALACAIASRNPAVLGAITAESQSHLSPEAAEAARTAAAIMSMNNVYYRFLHLTDNSKYKEIPARLRMQGIRTHGVDHADFELWCTAVSAINNCQTCVASHEKVLREKGITEEQVAAAVRIAAVIHATAVVFDAAA
ncbi:MAG TPA: carboxymuconolactone decarboxylase family protein [Bryobacteraceae bacterium]|nr:carboxymuconolactone decarboxylase family protein [Bryobacteraceae bacterium]